MQTQDIRPHLDRLRHELRELVQLDVQTLMHQRCPTATYPLECFEALFNDQAIEAILQEAASAPEAGTAAILFKRAFAELRQCWKLLAAPDLAVAAQEHRG